MYELFPDLGPGCSERFHKPADPASTPREKSEQALQIRMRARSKCHVFRHFAGLYTGWILLANSSRVSPTSTALRT